MGWDNRQPRQPAFIWKVQALPVYELPIRNFAHVVTWIEVREHADGRTTVKELQFPRAHGGLGDI